MKCLIVISCVLLLQVIYSSPVPQPACDEVFSYEICEQYDQAGNDETRVKRQLSGVDKQLLEQVLKAKLDFLIRLGFLKRIPLIGQFIHEMIEKDPEGVSKALSGGIFAIVALVTQLIAGGALGR